MNNLSLKRSVSAPNHCPLFFLLLLLHLICVGRSVAQQPIDRKKLVERHTVVNTKVDTLSSLSVGNGRFAFTVDVTGLQTFPELYQNGIPLGTQSEWGWNYLIDTSGYRFEETLRSFDVDGKKVEYSVQDQDTDRKKRAVEWFRQNPHRIHLATIGFELQKKDGSIAKVSDLQNIRQTLNLWTGEIHSTFSLEGVPVEVFTTAHQQADAIAAKVISPLLKQRRLRLRIRFAEPTASWTDRGAHFTSAKSTSIQSVQQHGAVLRRQLQTSQYFTSLQWSSSSEIQESSVNSFTVTPGAASEYAITCGFSVRHPAITPLSFEATKTSSTKGMERFWKSGGAVDFSECTDPRAPELERRIVLSQYLTKIQCSGNYPPQETGLTYNSWYGRPHLEMHWWHGVHFSLWNRHELVEPSVEWYKSAYPSALHLAKRQGYSGARWPKMTDNEGNESPSSIGSFLIWQQPHLIYFAELSYRTDSSRRTLEKYAELVFATADFMASYARYDSLKRRYVLGPALIPAQERFKATTTINPAFELVYWKWALTTAQQWRVRMQLDRNKIWDDVITKLSPLTFQDGRYLFTEDGTDSYTNPVYRTDHPSVLGALGILPRSHMVEPMTMRTTFKWIMNNWEWEHTWGWDFPMTAMTATRLGLPDQAIDALMMDITTNTYLNNGHNYQDKRLTLYLPGNGGLLTAIAMMCAGFDGNTRRNPGFPANGKWNVKWEGLKPMP